MWTKSQSNIKPDTVFEDKSSGTVYVRRNITEVEVQGEMGEKPIKMYEYEENKIDAKDWETYRTVLDHSDELADLQGAVIELAGIVAEG